MALQVARLTGNDDGARVTVPAADGTTATIQDIYNALRTFEERSENMDMRELTDPKTAGKTPLGAGKQVGITLNLLNKTTVEFEGRAGPAVIACLVDGGNLTAQLTWDGTATAGDAGTQLTDSSTTFAGFGIQSGNTIRNVTDGSIATVTTVDSETQITHTALAGGVDNDWGINDVWEVDSTHPFSPTAFTHVAFAQDVSPSIVEVATKPTEAHIEATYTDATDTITMQVWLDRLGVTVTSPTSCTVNWYNADGTILFSETDAGPDAQGSFFISRVQSPALTPNTAYYVDVSVTDAVGTVTNRRGTPTVGS